MPADILSQLSQFGKENEQSNPALSEAIAGMTAMGRKSKEASALIQASYAAAMKAGGDLSKNIEGVVGVFSKLLAELNANNSPRLFKELSRGTAAAQKEVGRLADSMRKDLASSAEKGYGTLEASIHSALYNLSLLQKGCNSFGLSLQKINEFGAKSLQPFKNSIGDAIDALWDFAESSAKVSDTLDDVYVPVMKGFEGMGMAFGALQSKVENSILSTATKTAILAKAQNGLNAATKKLADKNPFILGEKNYQKDLLKGDITWWKNGEASRHSVKSIYDKYLKRSGQSDSENTRENFFQDLQTSEDEEMRKLRKVYGNDKAKFKKTLPKDAGEALTELRAVKDSVFEDILKASEDLEKKTKASANAVAAIKKANRENPGNIQSKVGGSEAIKSTNKNRLTNQELVNRVTSYHGGDTLLANAMDQESIASSKNLDIADEVKEFSGKKLELVKDVINSTQIKRSNLTAASEAEVQTLVTDLNEAERKLSRARTAKSREKYFHEMELIAAKARAFNEDIANGRQRVSGLGDAASLKWGRLVERKTDDIYGDDFKNATGAAALGVGLVYVAKEFSKFLDKWKDKVEELAKTSSKLAGMKAETGGMFTASGFDEFREKMNLTGKEMAEIAGDMADAFKTAGVSMSQMTEVAGNIKDAFGALDPATMKQALDVMKNFTEEQGRILLGGAGTSQDRSNLIANVIESGTAEQVLNLMNKGVFNPEDATMNLSEGDKAIVDALQDIRTIDEDINMVCKDIFGKFPSVFKVGFFAAKAGAAAASAVAQIALLSAIARNTGGGNIGSWFDGEKGGFLRNAKAGAKAAGRAGKGVLGKAAGALAGIGGTEILGGAATLGTVGTFAAIAAPIVVASYLKDLYFNIQSKHAAEMTGDRSANEAMTGFGFSAKEQFNNANYNSGNGFTGAQSKTAWSRTGAYAANSAGIGAAACLFIPVIGPLVGGLIGAIAGAIGGGVQQAVEDPQREMRDEAYKNGNWYAFDEHDHPTQIFKHLNAVVADGMRRLIQLSENGIKNDMQLTASVQRTLKLVKSGKFTRSWDLQAETAKESGALLSSIGGSDAAYLRSAGEVAVSSAKSFSENMEELSRKRNEILNDEDSSAEAKRENARSVLREQAELTKKFVQSMMDSIGEYEKIPGNVGRILETGMRQVVSNLLGTNFSGTGGIAYEAQRTSMRNSLENLSASLDKQIEDFGRAEQMKGEFQKKKQEAEGQKAAYLASSDDYEEESDEAAAGRNRARMRGYENEANQRIDAALAPTGLTRNKIVEDSQAIMDLQKGIEENLSKEAYGEKGEAVTSDAAVASRKHAFDSIMAGMERMLRNAANEKERDAAARAISELKRKRELFISGSMNDGGENAYESDKGFLTGMLQDVSAYHVRNEAVLQEAMNDSRTKALMDKAEGYRIADDAVNAAGDGTNAALQAEKKVFDDMAKMAQQVQQAAQNVVALFENDPTVAAEASYMKVLESRKRHFESSGNLASYSARAAESARRTIDAAKKAHERVVSGDGELELERRKVVENALQKAKNSGDGNLVEYARLAARKSALSARRARGEEVSDGELEYLSSRMDSVRSLLGKKGAELADLISVNIATAEASAAKEFETAGTTLEKIISAASQQIDGAFNAEKERLATRRGFLDTQVDLLQTIGGPVEEVVALESKRVDLARQSLQIATRQYEAQKAAGVTGEKLEQSKLEISKAQAEVIKASYGAQNSMLEKIFGSMIGAFGELTGIGRAGNAAWFGMGYTQASNGMVASPGKRRGGYREKLFQMNASLGGAFSTGGLVGGDSPEGDRVLARLNSGEMVLNKKQIGNLSKQVGAGSPEHLFQIANAPKFADGGIVGGSYNESFNDEEQIAYSAMKAHIEELYSPEHMSKVYDEVRAKGKKTRAAAKEEAYRESYDKYGLDKSDPLYKQNAEFLEKSLQDPKFLEKNGLRDKNGKLNVDLGKLAQNGQIKSLLKQNRGMFARRMLREKYGSQLDDMNANLPKVKDQASYIDNQNAMRRNEEEFYNSHRDELQGAENWDLEGKAYNDKLEEIRKTNYTQKVYDALSPDDKSAFGLEQSRRKSAKIKEQRQKQSATSRILNRENAKAAAENAPGYGATGGNAPGGNFGFVGGTPSVKPKKGQPAESPEEAKKKQEAMLNGTQAAGITAENLMAAGKGSTQLEGAKGQGGSDCAADVAAIREFLLGEFRDSFAVERTDKQHPGASSDRPSDFKPKDLKNLDRQQQAMILEAQRIRDEEPGEFTEKRQDELEKELGVDAFGIPTDNEAEHQAALARRRKAMLDPRNKKKDGTIDMDAVNAAAGPTSPEFYDKMHHVKTGNKHFGDKPKEKESESAPETAFAGTQITVRVEFDSELFKEQVVEIVGNSFNGQMSVS